MGRWSWAKWGQEEFVYCRTEVASAQITSARLSSSGAPTLSARPDILALLIAMFAGHIGIQVWQRKTDGV